MQRITPTIYKHLIERFTEAKPWYGKIAVETIPRKRLRVDQFGEEAAFLEGRRSTTVVLSVLLNGGVSLVHQWVSST